MGDHLLSDYLLGKYKDEPLDREDLLKEIKQDEIIHKYLGNKSNRLFNMGLLQAFSVTLAEDLDLEIFEVYPESKDNNEMREAFIHSLIWRSGESITEKTKTYMQDYMFSSDDSIDQVIDLLVQKGCASNHPLNAHYLTRILLNQSLPVRDSIWTTRISNYDDNILRIIYWSWENSDIVNPRAAELYLKILIWFLSSTNNKVRDSATKALVTLFKKYPEKIINILQQFQSVDDPYILERLYAAVFGGVVRSGELELHREVANYIYQEIFNKPEVYPHILLRDYARQTIEYILHTKNLPEINKDKIRPPYKSTWYDHLPTNKEIDELRKEKTTEQNAHLSYGVNRVISSMTTEYGKEIGMYGDFGRYVFGSKVRAWENQFKSDQQLSNIAIKRVFEMGYNLELHGTFDRRINNPSHHVNTVERIGKKYQWIAFHELMAKLTDNFPTYEEKKIYTEEYESYLNLDRENIIGFLDWGLKKGYVELDETDHIVRIDKIPDSQYNGPWEPFLRDIDPTFLQKGIKGKKYDLIPNQLPVNPTIDWVKASSADEDIVKYFEMEYNNETYIALYSLFDWQYRNATKTFSGRDEKFFNAAAFFVRDNEKKEIIKRRKGTLNDHVVPLSEAHDIFAYEHFWSQSYKDFEEERIGYCGNKEIPACHDYSWETDYSKEGELAIKYIIPAKILVNYFNLRQTEEGMWQDNNGNTLCFDSRVFGYDSCLLFKKDELARFLKENDYSLMWGAYTQKVAQKHHNRTWYTVDYQEGEFEKLNVKEDVYKNERDF